jgi:hypothetical protein
MRMGNGIGSTKKNFIVFFCYSPKIIRMIKSRRLRWAGHIVKRQGGRSSFKILTGNPTGKRHLTILQWILKK